MIIDGAISLLHITILFCLISSFIVSKNFTNVYSCIIDHDFSQKCVCNFSLIIIKKGIHIDLHYPKKLPQ